MFVERVLHRLKTKKFKNVLSNAAESGVLFFYSTHYSFLSKPGVYTPQTAFLYETVMCLIVCIKYTDQPQRTVRRYDDCVERTGGQTTALKYSKRGKDGPKDSLS